MSQIVAAHKNSAGKIPNFKSKALFTIREFNTEINAAGVPDFYCRPPDNSETERICDLYKQLPSVVKEMFFSPSFHGRIRSDIPLYIIRDFILFADDDRWNRLKIACDKSKKEGMVEIYEFLNDFLEFQRSCNNFRLGAAKKLRDKDSLKLNPREQAYLEICKPYKWLGKTWQDNFTQDCSESQDDEQPTQCRADSKRPL